MMNPENTSVTSTQKSGDEALAIRKSGTLIAHGKNIRCPVIAIHGDYDPHPADGVKIPLTRVVKNFRFILFKKNAAIVPGWNALHGNHSTQSCGQNWHEKYTCRF